MSGGDILSKNASRRFHVDKKMIGMLSAVAVLGVFLVISTVIATHTLSGLRGFASFQTNWTEARKEATFQLVNYFKTKDDYYRIRFDSALQLIDSAEQLRYELLKDQTDRARVRELFLKTHAQVNDIGNMTRTFERFHNFTDFKKAVTEWVRSDEVISRMKALSAEASELIEKGNFAEPVQAQYVRRAMNLDRQLTQSQYRLAEALASGTQFLNFIVLCVSISLALILIVTGGLLSFRFLKSIKSWSREIEVSEQQYRSLFEQNPNAVFSISKDGWFIDANKALENMIGYPLEELKGTRFTQFLKDSELDKVSVHFKKALDGKPQAFETVGVLGNGELIHVEVTNLPIFVDGEITGVYGIAQDITDRKQAEQQVKEQLQEKTHLLSEVHDRVKNNLALISSLIQLQQIAVTEKEGRYLGSTVSRIHSIAMVHEQLYHKETFSSIRMDEYVKELSESVRKKYSDRMQNTELIVEASSVVLSISQAIPAGLLLNELLGNACKHGTGRSKGKILVSLHQDKDEVILSVSDSGSGLPDDIKPQKPSTLGMRLISVLVKQLGATFELANTNGASFTIRFIARDKLSKSA